MQAAGRCPLPIGVAGRTSVLRQGRYLVVRVAEALQKGPVLALATGRPLAGITLLSDAGLTSNCEGRGMPPGR